MKPVWTVKVQFKERGYWSKSYTYLSTVPLAVEDIVVVPTNDFYGIGRVVAITDGQEESEFNLKYVLVKLEF